jgi:hypothetical protein
MLRRLVDQYFDNNKSLQKRFLLSNFVNLKFIRFMVDSLNAYKLLARNTAETIPLKSLRAVESLCETISGKLKMELTTKQVLKRNTVTEEKELSEFKDAIDHLVEIRTKVETKRTTIEDSSEFSYLPLEIVLHIFSYLTNPNDLCSSSLVSLYWNFLANEDHLYKELVKFQFPSNYKKKSSEDFKSLYITLYVGKRSGREWTAYGLYITRLYKLTCQDSFSV